MRAKRLAANRNLVKTLAALVEVDGGEQRFSQILVNNDFVSLTQTFTAGCVDVNYWRDEYNLEPDALNARVLAALERLASEG